MLHLISPACLLSPFLAQAVRFIAMLRQAKVVEEEEDSYLALLKQFNTLAQSGQAIRIRK